jgi:hypothetical protein
MPLQEDRHSLLLHASQRWSVREGIFTGGCTAKATATAEKGIAPEEGSNAPEPAIAGTGIGT